MKRLKNYRRIRLLLQKEVNANRWNCCANPFILCIFSTNTTTFNVVCIIAAADALRFHFWFLNDSIVPSSLQSLNKIICCCFFLCFYFRSKCIGMPVVIGAVSFCHLCNSTRTYSRTVQYNDVCLSESVAIGNKLPIQFEFHIFQTDSLHLIGAARRWRSCIRNAKIVSNHWIFEHLMSICTSTVIGKHLFQMMRWCNFRWDEVSLGKMYDANTADFGSIRWQCGYSIERFRMNQIFKTHHVSGIC